MACNVVEILNIKNFYDLVFTSYIVHDLRMKEPYLWTTLYFIFPNKEKNCGVGNKKFLSLKSNTVVSRLSGIRIIRTCKNES